MKKISNFFGLMLFLVYILSGCTHIKRPRESTPVFVVWKSKGLKFADQGFLVDNGAKTKLEIYSSGQAVANISITKNKICSGLVCMSKREFNKQYLSSHYPDTILENLLHGREIFKGRGKRVEKDGFSQKIKSNNVDIKYIVSGNDIGFKDEKSGITIIIKRGMK